VAPGHISGEDWAQSTYSCVHRVGEKGGRGGATAKLHVCGTYAAHVYKTKPTVPKSRLEMKVAAAEVGSEGTTFTHLEELVSYVHTSSVRTTTHNAMEPLSVPLWKPRGDCGGGELARISNTMLGGAGGSAKGVRTECNRGQWSSGGARHQICPFPIRRQRALAR